MKFPARLKDGDLHELILTMVANYIVMVAGCVALARIDYGWLGSFALGYIAAQNNGNALLKFLLDKRLKRLEMELLNGRK